MAGEQGRKDGRAQGMEGEGEQVGKEGIGEQLSLKDPDEVD
ncbi:MAG: hypothetical protein WBI81_01245 [Limnochordia bacterium]